MNSNITVINPIRIDEQEDKIRVAAYCRVSTEQEEQQNSYNVQIAYYTDLINRKKEWTLAGIFADVNYCQRNGKINNKKEEQQKFAGKYNFQKKIILKFANRDQL